MRPIIKKLNMKTKFGKVVEVKYIAKKGNIYDRDDIRKVTSQFSKDMKKKGVNGYIWVNLLNDQHQWRGARKASIGEEPNLYGDDDYYIDGDEPQTSYTKFTIIFMKTGPKTGGKTDEKNDCLWDCLNKCIPYEENPWKKPHQLKQFLEIDRRDPVHIDDLQKIQEELPKYNISCTGDYYFTSSVKSHRRIELKLINGHYSVEKKKKVADYFYTPHERKPISYIRSTDDQTIHYYASHYSSIRSIPSSDFKELCQEKRDRYFFRGVSCQKEDLISDHKKYREIADELKEATKGKLNLYKTETTNFTALNFFDRYASNLDSEVIEQDEAIWINDATQGALIECQSYTGKAYKYDVISHYPSIQKDPHMLFPIKRGNYHTFTQEEFQKLPFYQYGIYICNVEGKHRFFKRNKNNKYTHIDLNYMKTLGIKFTIDHECSPNALIYTRDKLIEGHNLFGKYIDYVGKLKMKGVAGAKNILNQLWGSLCQSELKKIIITDDEEKEFPDDCTPVECYPLSDTKYMCKYVQNEKYFSTNFARIKPFLIAKGRMKIINIILPHIDFVKRVHTDGFITSKRLDIKLGEKLGDLRYEGKCKEINIINNILIKGKFE